MEFPYTINDIRAVVKVSQQSLYNLIKKHQSFFHDNSTRRQRKVYYSQAAMDFFISYYQPTINATDTEGRIKNPTDTEGQTTRENAPLERSYREEEQEARIDALQAEIKALQGKLDALQKQLDAKEAERVDLLRQNGILCLTLQQEKTEKMLLLPSPKKTLGEKVKSLFHKDAHNPEKQGKIFLTIRKKTLTVRGRFLSPLGVFWGRFLSPLRKILLTDKRRKQCKIRVFRPVSIYK